MPYSAEHPKLTEYLYLFSLLSCPIPTGCLLWTGPTERICCSPDSPAEEASYTQKEEDVVQLFVIHMTVEKGSTAAAVWRVCVPFCPKPFSELCPLPALRLLPTLPALLPALPTLFLSPARGREGESITLWQSLLPWARSPLVREGEKGRQKERISGEVYSTRLGQDQGISWEWKLGQDTWRGTGQQHGSLGGDGGSNLDFKRVVGWYI
ncbi:hypothetical protein J4Q44_G00004230 [Coregonus suidteri]|uniref:Uncharacterized protein n=1 Tax=Coregonus suidteri TaxID=861788 RepID=A0AAN8R6L3_9TELE